MRTAMRIKQELTGLLLGLTIALAGCGGFAAKVETELTSKPNARILALGDSVMWWNSPENGSIADVVAQHLREPVVNLAEPGAAISHPDPAMAAEGLDIRAQYRSRDWDWVLVEGGANDLGDEGGARGCQRVLDELISADGQNGEIPQLVQRIRADGARVVALGYYQLPSFGEPDGFCGERLAMLGERIERMAALDPGVIYVAMADEVDPTDRAAYDRDAVHPSARSSARIGKRIADAISNAEAR